jgi:alanine dehydrogenase
MIYGIPKEIRTDEMRVGAMPFLVKELVRKGNKVFVEAGAGEFCEAPDSHYEQAGATIVPSPDKLYSQAEVILKVREPKSVEYELIRPDQIIFAYFHFHKNPELIKALSTRGCTCFAYEFVEDENKKNPLTKSLGYISGQMSIINGAFFLQKQHGGRGITLGSVAELPPANVMIIGAGNVGQQAAKTACALGANVVVLDTNYEKLVDLEVINQPNLSTTIYDENSMRTLIKDADIVVSCIHLPEKSTPIIITREIVKTMKLGSVIVEVDIDFGGSIETGKNTTHNNPTFIVDGIVHYCVSNITSGVPNTASRGLSKALLPYLNNISSLGFEQTVLKDIGFSRGVVIYKGHIIKEYFALALGLPFSNLFDKINELVSEHE